MVKKKINFANYTSIIATVATAVLAITALITVYITVSAWREEREANRPYFTFQESPKVVAGDSLDFEIRFTNVGEHPAINLWSKSVVFNSDLSSQPIAVDEYALVNDIPQNASATLLITLEKLEEQAKTGNIPPHFAVIVLRYEDPIIDKYFEQIIYIQWNGMEDGNILATNHAEEEEKMKIIDYFNNNNIKF
ncbi:MAG: hypothetical protein APF84_03815 [Gracilibacter sp. BRH_c7a]|nr:MAG: hypothetical protein APF84_03815 [Gracilibacter sp. BRH_c7a]